MKKNKRIICVIWTFNPDINLLSTVLEKIVNQVNLIILVDNGSANANEIKHLIKKLEANVEFVEIGWNSGVHALNVGIERALTQKADYILMLDDDTIVSEDAISLALEIFKNLPQNVGVICLGDKDRPNLLQETTHMRIFSGSIIKANILRRHSITIREEFFLDQADFDFFWKIRKFGYKIFLINKKLIDHRIGESIELSFKKPNYKRALNYEPPWRFYYIVRNSTVLLLERRISTQVYLFQIFVWLVPLLYRDGYRVALKTFIKGFLDGIFRKLGYQYIPK